MNKRMHAIVKYMEAGRGVIDVGTDHGYFPVWMATHGYKGNIIATDINAGPLQNAMNTAQEAGVLNKIHFCQCDGLDGCKPDSMDTIVIAGMGGELICRILDRAEWCMDRRYKLILQPMTKSEVLRYWLVNNEFEICNEDLICEGGTIYQLGLAASPGSPTANCSSVKKSCAWTWICMISRGKRLSGVLKPPLPAWQRTAPAAAVRSMGCTEKYLCN